ncbi:MAG: histidinol dehydrogenase [Rubrivivax sp.]|nr:histidinol dehydrogenase [Rubrivivax sp.]
MNAPVNIRRLSTADADFEPQFQRVLHWSAETDAAIEDRVAQIIDDVRARGDAAVLELTARFDGVQAASMAELEIGRAELLAALDAITPAQRRALEAAAERVRDYHQRQLEATSRSWQYRDADGTLLGQKVTPLDRVGIYVPGGKAAYPSSVLMNAIPAQVAGVGEIVMVVPTPRGERNALVLAAASIAGATRVFTIGGAQAVAALAYGTATVPRVDKITGPGNAYVASAKRRVFGQVGIDMIAGPSEILVLADGSTPADWVAMDLFSQAEHDELAQSILLCPDAAYIAAVHEAIERLLPQMPRAAVIRASLEGRGALIHTRSLEEACAISNRIAPEHLEVSSAEPQKWEPLLKHAGALFLGAFTSESLGDYCAGPNHVLPTSGTARFSSPLGVYDFVKRTSLIEVSEAGAQLLGPIAAELAYGEGLQAHARAAEMRLREGVAALSAPVAFSVRPVDRSNAEAVMKLQVAAGQRAFVSPVDRSLAQVAYEPCGRAMAMFDGEQAVGMMLLYDVRKDEEDPANQLYVWRLLVDARFQKRGYGRLAMAWVVDEARREGYAEVGLSHVDKPGHAGAFYEKLGFAYTGEVDEGERKMLLKLEGV